MQVTDDRNARDPFFFEKQASFVRLITRNPIFRFHESKYFKSDSIFFSSDQIRHSFTDICQRVELFQHFWSVRSSLMTSTHGNFEKIRVKHCERRDQTPSTLTTRSPINLKRFFGKLLNWGEEKLTTSQIPTIILPKFASRGVPEDFVTFENCSATSRVTVLNETVIVNQAIRKGE